MVNWTGEIASPIITEDTDKGYLKISIDWGEHGRGPVVVSPELFEQFINSTNWVNEIVALNSNEQEQVVSSQDQTQEDAS